MLIAFPSVALPGLQTAKHLLHLLKLLLLVYWKVLNVAEMVKDLMLVVLLVMLSVLLVELCDLVAKGRVRLPVVRVLVYNGGLQFQCRHLVFLGGLLSSRSLASGTSR